MRACVSTLHEALDRSGKSWGERAKRSGADGGEQPPSKAHQQRRLAWPLRGSKPAAKK
jgi:hypothetical protein